MRDVLKKQENLDSQDYSGMHIKKKTKFYMQWKKYLPIIGIILFVYVLIKVDLGEVWQELLQVDIYYLLISLVLVFIMLFIQTFKWHIIAVYQKIKIPYSESFKINLITNFYGFITPSKLGTVLRAEYLRKYTGNFGKGFFNFVVDKILDIASIIFTAIIFSFIFKDTLNVPMGIFISIFLIFVLGTLFFIKKERSEFVLRFFHKYLLPKKIKDRAKSVFDSFYDEVPKKRYFILFFLLNIINWIIIYLITYFIGLSLGINLGLIYYLAILPIGTIVTMIPISINGLGTREATLISLFALFGIGSAKVFSMSILSLVFSGILPVVIALFFIWRKE